MYSNLKLVAIMGNVDLDHWGVWVKIVAQKANCDWPYRSNLDRYPSKFCPCSNSAQTCW